MTNIYIDVYNNGRGVQQGNWVEVLIEIENQDFFVHISKSYASIADVPEEPRKKNCRGQQWGLELFYCELYAEDIIMG